MQNNNWNIKVTPFRLFLLLLAGIGFFLAAYRLYRGLGVTTNLTDEWPWGLWIGIDLVIIALAGVGFSIAIITHVIGIKKYKVFARRALVMSLVAYLFVLATLILEIGRWDNFWRPFFSWGFRSPMFEVFLCIAAYTILQMVEFLEITTERVNQKQNKVIKKIMPVVIIVAAVLPLGHQASLGALYLLFPYKLYPLWYSSMLPWFFLISSFYIGPSVIILDAFLSTKRTKETLDVSVFKGLARISGCIMIVYLFLKLGDLVLKGFVPYLFMGSIEGLMYWIEIIVGTLLPVFICFSPIITKSKGLLSFAIFSIFGLVLSRINVVFTGMFASLGSAYSPSWIEWGISIGLFSTFLLFYLFILENFNVPLPIRKNS